MRAELSFHSLFIPALLPLFIASSLLFVGIDLALSRLGCYRLVWHPALFRAALFCIVFCAGSLLLRPWH
ncbi:DUF1656 domain-containing protein [Dyella choica]|uniref:DUF1656 domain-containing protein n=1 Tax=Dyella choica TaxID=1927959 RepID=A0A432M9U3_9GAMM|nr:DUF1656 domain-containing protein [Dyella choica]RUL78984.1 DUF1656 domain-containing protein [Dyella choica]